jgi:hypothetical protein
VQGTLLASFALIVADGADLHWLSLTLLVVGVLRRPLRRWGPVPTFEGEATLRSGKNL